MLQRAKSSIEYATDYEYVDSFVEAGVTYDYRLADVDFFGKVTYHATRSVAVTRTPVTVKIDQFTVLDAYPNPFNPSTTIRYLIPESDNTVKVTIYDISGKLINSLLNQ